MVQPKEAIGASLETFERDLLGFYRLVNEYNSKNPNSQFKGREILYSSTNTGRAVIVEFDRGPDNTDKRYDWLKEMVEQSHGVICERVGNLHNVTERVVIVFGEFDLSSLDTQLDELLKERQYLEQTRNAHPFDYARIAQKYSDRVSH